MFETFKKLRIRGGCFENETELELFDKHAVSVLYGRNGSGKTTIARGIKELLKSDMEKNTDFSVTSDAIIPEDKKSSVYVFDEDFVRDQVRVEKEGINTIIMLGEQVELDNQIEKKKKEFEEVEKEYRKIEEYKQKYDNKKEDISPFYYFEQIKEELRADDGWAGIDRDLKKNTIKSRVTDNLVETLADLDEPLETYEQLRNKVITDLTLYRKTNNAQPIAWTKPPQNFPEQLELLGELLSKPLDTPILNDREKRLMSMLASHPLHSVPNTKSLLNEHWPFCPICLREVTEKDQTMIADTLALIMNEEADKYRELLQSQLKNFSSVEITLPEFGDGLNEKELLAAREASQDLNSILTDIRDKISKREKAIYDSLKDPFPADVCKKYVEAVFAWKHSLDGLDECVKQFNFSVNEHKKLFNQIVIENNNLARKKLAPLMSCYKNAIVKRQENFHKWEMKSKECENLHTEIQKLKAQKERTDIALDYINHELQFVFYSNYKMKLEPGEGCYKLKINGRAVKPKKISIGERNVLGLCYFFAKLFGGKTEANKYTSEYFIVMDDPISSFDYGNRIGIMSLLRFQFDNILKGNANSRILVMSHDLRTVFDLVKILSEVEEKSCNSFTELVNKRLKSKPLQNEYKELLEYIYSYADNGDIDDASEMSIGNIMRRALEAFSSFCYNITFEKMLRKDDVLIAIPEEKRGYYKNFMYRLTLNTESHMKEKIYALNSITAYFTKEEKVQTAKSVLLFLYYINKSHLAAYIEEERLAKIEEWKGEEKGWIVKT